jgi:hypothetical protein
MAATARPKAACTSRLNPRTVRAAVGTCALAPHSNVTTTRDVACAAACGVARDVACDAT